jgi:hypothetical protein
MRKITFKKLGCLVENYSNPMGTFSIINLPKVSTLINFNNLEILFVEIGLLCQEFIEKI